MRSATSDGQHDKAGRTISHDDALHLHGPTCKRPVAQHVGKVDESTQKIVFNVLHLAVTGQ